MKATGKLDYIEMPATGATLDRAKAFYSQRLRLGVHRLRPDLRRLQRRTGRRVPGRRGGGVGGAAAGALFGRPRRDACRGPGGERRHPQADLRVSGRPPLPLPRSGRQRAGGVGAVIWTERDAEPSPCGGHGVGVESNVPSLPPGRLRHAVYAPRLQRRVGGHPIPAPSQGGRGPHPPRRHTKPAIALQSELPISRVASGQPDCWGVASGKAAVFGTAIPRFERRPSQRSRQFEEPDHGDADVQRFAGSVRPTERNPRLPFNSERVPYEPASLPAAAPRNCWGVAMW